MDLVPLVFSSGWASGVNAYLVVLVLGVAERWGGVDQLPAVLGRTDVLIAAAVMFALEFVTDKVPYLDSTWDAISTVIRPTLGAALALVLTGDASSMEQAAYAVLGGGTALVSHAVKAGNRLAINASPEPLSNVAVSTGEDVAVLGVIALAVSHPWLAFAVSLVLLIAGLALLYVLMRLARRGWRRWKGRERGRPAPRILP